MEDNDQDRFFDILLQDKGNGTLAKYVFVYFVHSTHAEYQITEPKDYEHVTYFWDFDLVFHFPTIFPVTKRYVIPKKMGQFCICVLAPS